MSNFDGHLVPEYVKFEREWFESIEGALPKAQAAKLGWAIIAYYLYGEERKLPHPAKLMFEAYRPQCDFRRAKSIEQLSRKQEIRQDSLGKNPRFLDGKQNCFETNISQNQVRDELSTSEDSDNHHAVTARSTRSHRGYIDKDIDIETSPRTRGARPSACIKTDSGENAGGALRIPERSEVAAYCEQCGLVVSPDRFYDYYEARGWRDKAGEWIGDWRAMLRVWNHREGRFPVKPSDMDPSSNDGRRKQFTVEQIIGDDKNAGMWLIASPPRLTGLIPNSHNVSRGEAERLAIELYPELGEAS